MPAVRFRGATRPTLRALVEQKAEELRQRHWPDIEFDYRAAAAAYTPEQLEGFKSRVLAEIDNGCSENVIAKVIKVSRTQLYRYAALPPCRSDPPGGA